MVLRSYAVIARDVNSDDPDDFEYVTKWKYLPKGVYFFADQGVFVTDNIVDTVPTAIGAGFPFPSSAAIGLTQLPYVEYNPRGRLNDTGRLILSRGHGLINAATGRIQPIDFPDERENITFRLRSVTGQFNIEENLLP